MDLLTRNAAAVQRYLVDVYPRIEQGLIMPEEPPDRKHKGTSRPPLTEDALRLFERNREASRWIVPFYREAMRHDLKLGGHALSTLLREAWHDHTATKRWRLNEGEDRRKREALWGLSHLIARAIHAAAGQKGEEPPELYVTTDPGAEEASLDPRFDPPGPSRSIAAHDSYRTIVADLERLKEEHALKGDPISEAAAEGLMADRLFCSVWRIRDAKRFVKRERAGFAPPEREEGVWRSWEHEEGA